jgi:hypothetical protein
MAIVNANYLLTARRHDYFKVIEIGRFARLIQAED